MASPTYTVEVIVLKKTKLGEADLILTCITTDGSQVRLVAKGARKPTSSFSSRLEVFSHARILAAKGRSLDIVKEATLLDGHESLRLSFERTAAASVLCEFLCKVTETELEGPRLFPLALAALDVMGTCEVKCLEGLAAACVVKGFALIGLRPELTSCVSCGEPAFEDGKAVGPLWFSHTEGGVVCPSCARTTDSFAIEPALVGWLRAYLFGTFAEICRYESFDAAYPCLQLCQQWCRVHVGAPIKSVDYLLVNHIAASTQ